MAALHRWLRERNLRPPISLHPSRAGAERAPIFRTKTGKPWNLAHLRHEAERTLKAIGHPGYSLHGMRFNAARRVYLAGATWEEVADITGHETMGMAKMYAERAERARNTIARTEKQRALSTQVSTLKTPETKR